MNPSYLTVLLVVTAASLQSCRSERFPLFLGFTDDKHVINTEFGRLLIAPRSTDCSSLETNVATNQDLSNLVLDVERDMCDFVNGFDIKEYPEGTYTVAFAGYNRDSTDLSLWSCVSGQNLDSVQLQPAPRPGYDKDAERKFLSVGERCG